MPVQRKYIIRIIVITLALAIGGAIYYIFSPEESRFFPQCPFHMLTGYDCPGCGSQRALHHLLHLRLLKAFLSNPLLIILIPYLVISLWFEYFGGKEKYPRARKILFGRNAIYIILAAIILFWIGRNVV